MKRMALMGVLMLAGCAAPVAAPISASRQAVTQVELEYVNKFLVPAAAYQLLPRCPKPPGTACNDPAIVATLRDTLKHLHSTIYALRDFSDAAPDADATALIANARAELAAAVAMVPAKGATP